MTLPSARLDIYAMVHKGLRACMLHTLTEIGSCDWGDRAQTQRSLAQLVSLLDLCRAHQDSEDRFWHPALEARQPDASRQSAVEHRAHGQEMTGIAADAAALEFTAGAQREVAGIALYRRLAAFIAESFAHMEAEECANNAALWAHYSDPELRVVQRSQAAALAPEHHARFLRWMLASANSAERLQLAAGLRNELEPGMASAVTHALRPLLSPAEWLPFATATQVAGT